MDVVLLVLLWVVVPLLIVGFLVFFVTFVGAKYVQNQRREHEAVR